MPEFYLDTSGDLSLEVVKYLQSQVEGSNKVPSFRLCLLT